MSSIIEAAQRSSSNKSQHQFLELMKRLVQEGYRVADVFRDFCQLSHYSLQQAVEKYVNKELDKDVEERYLSLINQYRLESRHIFPEMFAHLVSGLQEERFDFLGELYMRLEIGDSEKGQFFTPSDIMKIMLMVTLNGVEQVINEKGYASLNDPACGSGGAFIFAADHINRQGLNPHSLFCVGQDVDATACSMSYIQCYLLDIPALILQGNSLTNEHKSHWYTLSYFTSGMYRKCTQPKQDRIPEQIALI